MVTEKWDSRRRALLLIAATLLLFAVIVSVQASRAPAGGLFRSCDEQDVCVSMESPGGLLVDARGMQRDGQPVTFVLLTVNKTDVGDWIVDHRRECGSRLSGPRCSSMDSTDGDCAATGTGSDTISVRCDRIAPGARVQLTNLGDTFRTTTDGGEAFNLSAFAGNDKINVGGTPARTGAWTVDLGSGNDTYRGSEGIDVVVAGSGNDTGIIGLEGNDQLDGGSGNDRGIGGREGNDTLKGGSGNDTLFGGPGIDSVQGGSGNDTVQAGPDAEASEPDAYFGDAGFDTLVYGSRVTRSISVVRIGATGGSSGERDEIDGFEKVFGTGADDSILGFSSEGNAGDDLLNGGDANDRINGDAGVDVIRGFGGNDTLGANDGVADTTISCGPGGFDRATIDLADPVPPSTDCETVDRREFGEEPGTRILTRGVRIDGREARIRLRCPGKVNRRLGCAGRLTLALLERGASRPQRTRYLVKPGETEAVTVKLTAAEAAKVRRSGRLPAIVSSREKGRPDPDSKDLESVRRLIALRPAAG